MGGGRDNLMNAVIYFNFYIRFMKKIFSLYSIKIYQPVKFYNKEKTDFLIKDLTNKENKCACIFCLWGTVM